MKNSFQGIVTILGALVVLSACSIERKQNKPEIVALKALKAPVIDGLAEDACWTTAHWHPISNIWLGPELKESDFKGNYKVVWDDKRLYLLVEVIDDTLIDIYRQDFTRWWDDDCVEIFIDENNSGGEHQYSHNAFAYHVGLNYQVVDYASDKLPHYYNDHVMCKRTKNGNKYTWEMAIVVHSDKFIDGVFNEPVKLEAEKEIGFAVAYCDNDYSQERENFIGSVPVEGEDKNRGWIDAGIFGRLVLEK